MTDEILHPGLEDEDIKLISEVWNSKEGGILALIKAGQLDPKKDFIRGDFRGWPLEGQDVRGIDFTGSDLRGTGINRAIRDESTILTDAILDDLPPPERRPVFEDDHPPQTSAWTYHWHAGVYRAFGHKLFLIFVRFVTGSIVVKESIVRDLEEAGITDFMILNLFSRHDVLIRVWADEISMKRLEARFRDNPEINHLNVTPPPIEIADVKHFPDKGRYPTLESVRSTLTDVDTAQLKDIQQKGERSDHFKKLRQAGLILDNDTRFVGNRIQFFIWVNCSRDEPENLRGSLLDVVDRLKQVRSKSVYFPKRGRTLAIVKGQVQPSQYYAIHEFLRQLTTQFEMILRFHVDTETMLVANQYDRYSCTINFDYARRDPSTLKSIPVRTIIEEGEGDRTEFKSTLRTNLRTGERDTRMDLEVVKTIAAFINSQGGRLVIGVGDDGKPIGLEADKFESEDRMNRHLGSLIRDRIGPEHIDYIRYGFSDYQGSRVLIVDCDRGRSPVYVKDANQERFYMRTGAATTELSGRRLTEYVTNHFRAI
jgi:Putative DNA-binding domain